ncbi:hypothetical protein AHF37_09370 [Paragonimus kellicotti]|nr:hypothetical protein AHF37_09370 [Paragonimus kellicotti]
MITASRMCTAVLTIEGGIASNCFAFCVSIPQADLLMTVISSHAEANDVLEEDFDVLNAQLDALLCCMDVLETQGDRICDSARQLVLECQEVRATMRMTNQSSSNSG